MKILRETRSSLFLTIVLVTAVAVTGGIAIATGQVRTDETVTQKLTEQYENSPLKVTSLGQGLYVFSGDGGDVTAIVDQCRRVLSADGVMIQFTYDLRPPGRRPLGNPAFAAAASRVVWANIPPARIVTMHAVAIEEPV